MRSPVVIATLYVHYIGQSITPSNMQSINFSTLFVFVDDLDKASEIVAHLVGPDWPKVYRALPFFPYRGEERLDADVDAIIKVTKTSSKP